MKSPTALSWVLGNSLVLVVLGLLFFASLYHWLALGGSPYPVAFLAVSGGWSASAHDRVLRYRQWKDEWDSMGGKAPRRGPSLRALHKLVAAAFWGLGAWGAVTYADELGFQIPIGMFWLGTLVMIGWSFLRLFRRRAPASHDVAVAVCLAKPSQSADIRQAYAAIPDYCRQLGSAAHQ